MKFYLLLVGHDYEGCNWHSLKSDPVQTFDEWRNYRMDLKNEYTPPFANVEEFSEYLYRRNQFCELYVYELKDGELCYVSTLWD